MKQKGLLLLMMLLGLGLMAAPALASTVSFDLSHQLTFSLSNLSFSYVDDSQGYEPQVSVNGQATWATGSEGPVFQSDAYSTQYSGNPLVNMSAVTSLDPILTMSQSLIGNAPGDAGGLNMIASNFISLVFTATADGDALLMLSDAITGQYMVAGQNGSPWFDTLNGDSLFSASMDADTADKVSLASSLAGFSDFTDSLNSSFVKTFLLQGLLAGDTVYLDLAFDTSIGGTSQVPLPPSVLLLGSGLAGLGMVGFRRRKKVS